MKRTSGLTGRHRPRRRGLRRLAFWLAFAAIVSGCAGTTEVVSDCPAPNVEEQDDIEAFLMSDPIRPAQAWVSRVLGHIYEVELREVRGEP